MNNTSKHSLLCTKINYGSASLLTKKNKELNKETKNKKNIPKIKNPYFFKIKLKIKTKKVYNKKHFKNYLDSVYSKEIEFWQF